MKKSVKSLGLIFLMVGCLIILSTFLTTAAISQSDVKVMRQGYKLSGAETQAYQMYGYCKYFYNQVARNSFVPAKTKTEFESFLAHPPYGTSISDCPRVECQLPGVWGTSYVFEWQCPTSQGGSYSESGASEDSGWYGGEDDSGISYGSTPSISIGTTVGIGV